MTVVRAKGHEFEAFVAKDSFSRRAVQFRNAIIQTLKKLGLTENHINIPEKYALTKAPAFAEWYFQGHKMYCSWSSGKYVDNLYVVAKVIELEVAAVLEGRKEVQDFISAFSEEHDVE